MTKANKEPSALSRISNYVGLCQKAYMNEILYVLTIQLLPICLDPPLAGA